jgi:hypothetical protein
MSSTYSAASEASASASIAPACEPSPSARSMTTAERCSSSTGQMSRSTETFVLCAGFPCQDLSVAGKRNGLAGERSGLAYALIGLLSRTSPTRGADGCPNCGASCGPSDMPLCRFECEPRTWERTTNAPASTLLPTPTASSYGSCRGGGMGRVGKWRHSLHSLKILHPHDWERMMGFPIGWTDVRRSATQLSRKLLSSLDAGFAK